VHVSHEGGAHSFFPVAIDTFSETWHGVQRKVSLPVVSTWSATSWSLLSFKLWAKNVLACVSTSQLRAHLAQLLCVVGFR